MVGESLLRSTLADMPMSLAKPCSTSSVQPLCSIDTGSARKVFCTKPPKVAMAHTATTVAHRLLKIPTAPIMPDTSRIHE